jgi:phenylpropionate dioxygenase-like ring-hydroxylating dioxygenase large terminal subunit
MLTTTDNERITRVGSGSPAGNMMRRYWVPACLTLELPEPDGAPLRVRLLGEDLIAFRDTRGEVGLIDAYCPHRRAPLFFGRNEECGLRCVYHGWKFDRHGVCVDMPSEPAGTTLQAKVQLTAYPIYEKAGLVWTYMGPKAKQPAPPDYEWMRAPDSQRFVSKTPECCNYLQAMEGGLDTAHSSFLHNNNISISSEPRQRDKAPRLEVEYTDYGYTYSSHRNLGDEGTYVRVYHYFVPFGQRRGEVLSWDGKMTKVPRNFSKIWMPVDDVNTMVYNIHYNCDPNAQLTPELIAAHEAQFGRAPEDLIPGTFFLKRNRSNDFLIDRMKQKTKTFTGIDGINTQDIALQESMELIVDRSKEFLGTSDKAIIATRRLLLEAISVVEGGGDPRGLDPATHRRVRAWDDIVPGGVDWRAHLAPNLVARW